MEFKRLDKVKFLGGVFPVGKDNEGWIDADLPPLDTTFVWGSLRSQDTDLFIIQHNHGADLETFMHYSSFFGEIDPKSLNSSKRFVLVTDDALEMVEASQVKEEAPKPKVDEPLHPSDEDAIAQSNSVDVVTPEDVDDSIQFEEENIQHEEVQPEQQVYGVNEPHFTLQTCPTDRMRGTVSKQRVIKSMKMAEPFTIDGVNGIEKGRAGDYLMLAESSFLFVYPKEGFDESYEYAEELVQLPILGKTFNILPEVAEYIDRLQVSNSEE
jgi:hypothetical protein